jgi:hypothetical protein
MYRRHLKVSFHIDKTNNLFFEKWIPFLMFNIMYFSIIYYNIVIWVVKLFSV